MNKLQKEKWFYIGAVLLATAAMAIGQSIIDAVTVSAAPSESVLIELYPRGDDGSGEDIGTDFVGRELLPEPGVKETTAEGELSDFLVPSLGENTADGTVRRLSDSPKVLIYHTHTTEAYRQDGSYTYKESSSFRTMDNEKNIVAVGETLAAELTGLGFTVIHDTTDHEPPKLSTSYDRSIVTIEKYLKSDPDIDIFIDVHRDAASVQKNKDDVVMIDGKRCARMMFVVGKGTNYDVKPFFDANYALADAVTRELESVKTGFTRDIRVKNGRYNQHISEMSLLVEMGHNANTLSEAQNSAVWLARSIRKAVMA